MKKISIQGAGGSFNSPRPFGVRVRGKKALSLIIIIFCLMTGSAWAEQVSDYTAYPPFLPRVTSPNILFLLDYSNSMVRPAYGTCSPISNTLGVTETVRNLDPDDTVSDTGILSNCRTRFSNLSYDYDSSTTYSGYFDSGVSGQKYDYGVSAPNLFTKNSGADGKWGANFLNWLTATQFDILKKVIIAGDLTPAPESAGGNINLRSVLTSGYTFRKQMNLAASTAGGESWTSCSSTNSPDCTSTTPIAAPPAAAASTASGWPTLTYNWIPTPGGTPSVALDYPGKNWAGEGISQAKTLPFAFTFYDNTYTQIWISSKGWASLTDPTAVTYGGNYWNLNMPDATSGYPNNFIAPYWDNLYIDAALSSAVKTFTVGSAPNRIFVITWENVRHFSATSNATNAQTFQALLYEGSNHIVFQYLDVNVQAKGGLAAYGTGRNATIGVENSSGNIAKKYSYCTACASDMVTNSQAIFATPHVSYTITPGNVTQFKPAPPLGIAAGNPAPCSGNTGPCSSSNTGPYNININAVRQVLGGGANCPSGFYKNKEGSTSTSTRCYDHETEALLQDFRDGELAGTLGFRLAIMRLNGDTTNAEGGTVIKHFNEKDTTSWSNVLTDTRGQLPTKNTPLAEALYVAQGYFRQNTTYNLGLTSSNSWTNTGTGADCGGNSKDPYCFTSAAQKVSCCKSFVLTVSSGNYSTDNGKNIYGDADNTETHTWLGSGWSSTDDAGNEGTKANGGWLDNVAYRAHIPGEHPNDLRGDLEGNQNLTIYPINTFGSVQTALSANVSASDTTIPVISTASFSSTGKIQIGDEIIRYTGKTAATFTGCTRGADSTSAASHTSGWKVYQAPISDGAKVLKRAAKYGGFDDTLGTTSNAYDADVTMKCPDGSTQTRGEDDRNCDGVPDTYFEASGGGDLKSKIIDAVTDILKSSASGTTVSVLSTSASGEGAIYQAYFYPAKIENVTEERTWPGYMRGFFLDKYQNLRDDASGGTYTCGTETCTYSGTPDAKLIMANSDKIARMCLNTTTNAVRVKILADATGDGQPDTTPSTDCPGTDPNVSMDEVTTIWEAGKKLALRDKSTRSIYTWADLNGDGAVLSTDAFDNSGETRLFTTDNKDTLKPYLCAGNATCVASSDEAENIINFVRGNAVTGYRNRCITISGATTEAGCAGSNQRVWALGDIVYSTPTLVSGPGEKFDEIYGDSTYRTFRNRYANRRSVIYAGGNDGMLHAFNGGVYKAGDDLDTGSVIESGRFIANASSSVNGFANGWSSSIELGDELWAFVPHDNLPHLAWLGCNGTATDPSVCSDAEYTHVYYVDQRPKVTDVRIFADDTDHPGGWGTILIMGMRYGGGAINVDLNGDLDTLDAGEQSFRSAFYVFDITNPENPPKFLWRFNDSGLGFTTSYPAIARICSNGTNPCTGTEKWYMVVGSGPKNETGTNNRDYGGSSTTQTGKIYVVNLLTGAAHIFTNAGVNNTGASLASNAFMGDPMVVDENIDFTADTVYIGSAVSTTGGKVYRIRTKGEENPANWELSTLVDAGRPLLVSPSASKDSQGKLWVFFGTGRLRSQADLSNSDQQYFYGIKDACGKAGTGSCTTLYTIDPTATATERLVDVSAVRVTSDTGSPTQVEGGTTLCGGTATCSYTGLRTEISKYGGWYIKLTVDGSNPSEKALSRSVVLGGLLLFTAYKPTGDMCSIFGDSNLYGLYYETGTAYIKPTLPAGTAAEQAAVAAGTVLKSISLGKGMPTAVGVAIGETVSGFVQKSTGEIVRIEAQPGLGVRSGAASWREKTGGGGTSEIETIYKHIVK